MTTSPSPGCVCGCSDAAGFRAHRIIAALAADDLDTAIMEGLLDEAACASCRATCRDLLREARDSRLAALAARERFRAREARLRRRQQERLQRRQAPAPSTGPAPLPAAAAAALARARAKAAGPTGR